MTTKAPKAAQLGDDQPAIARRNFLKGATLAGAAALAAPVAARRRSPRRAAGTLKAALPGPRQIAAETQPPVQGPGDADHERRRLHGRRVQDARHRIPGDELRLELPRPARGHHQPRRQQASPKSSPARTRKSRSRMAHGYAKIEGKPMAMICHGVVGLQHATMAMYNAWCDRVPVYRHGRQHHRGQQARARRRMGAFGDRHRRDHPRLHQVGRPADLAAAFRRVGGARLQDRDDAADGAGADRRSMPSCRKIRSTKPRRCASRSSPR